jgi:membrane associated rhomboid family serine protease
VLGAYILLYPRARVAVLFPIFVIIQVIQLPAVLVLGFWFVEQFFNGAFALTESAYSTAGVAWWAHIGGFLCGMVLINIFKRRGYRPDGRDAWWSRRIHD